MILNCFINYNKKINYSIIDPNQTKQWKSIGIDHVKNYINIKNMNKNIKIDLKNFIRNIYYQN